MKTLNITFTDKEHRELKTAKDKKKGKVSWHAFFMRLVRIK